jgi:hypothetical protein
MWVSYFNGGAQFLGIVNEYAAEDLSGSGTISPDPTTQIGPLKSTALPPSIIVAEALAFDSSGALWVRIPARSEMPRPHPAAS